MTFYASLFGNWLLTKINVLLPKNTLCVNISAKNTIRSLKLRFIPVCDGNFLFPNFERFLPKKKKAFFVKSAQTTWLFPKNYILIQFVLKTNLCLILYLSCQK